MIYVINIINTFKNFHWKKIIIREKSFYEIMFDILERKSQIIDKKYTKKYCLHGIEKLILDLFNFFIYY